MNLNFHEPQHGFIVLPLAELGLNPARPYQMQDLLNGKQFDWEGPRNFVELDPLKAAHVFHVAQRP